MEKQSRLSLAVVGSAMAIFHNGQTWSKAWTAVTICSGGGSVLWPAFEFANAGFKSFLVEYPPFSGRRVAQLRFPFSQRNGMLSRGACDHDHGRMRPCLASAYLHHHQHTRVEILTNAHVSGFGTSWTKNAGEFSDRPSVLSTGVTLHSGVGHIFGLPWLVAVICSVGAGIGFSAQQPWWPILAVVQAIVSLIVIVPTVVAGAKVGAVFDVIVLIALLLPWQESVITALQ